MARVNWSSPVTITGSTKVKDLDDRVNDIVDSLVSYVNDDIDGLMADYYNMESSDANKYDKTEVYNRTEIATQIANSVAVNTPIGLISMWSGDTATLPDEWKICDGLNGTPDLRDKFIVGSGNLYSTNDVGGSSDSVNVTHTHGASHSHTNTCDPSGGHEHYGFSDANASSYQSETVSSANYVASQAYVAANYEAYTLSGTTTVATEGRTSSVANHSHVITIATEDVETDESGEDGINKNLPPYYALAYIMKVA